MKSQERLDLLAQVAAWYYEQKLEQSEIAQRIGKSVSMVSRLLAEAHREGLIEIRVRFVLRTDDVLEQELKRRFGLRSASVLKQDLVHDNNRLRKVGELGARCIKDYLHDGMTIAVGWGRSVHQVVTAMPEMHLNEVTVVQMMGGMGSTDPMMAGSELARWLSEKLGAAFRAVQSPMVVESEEVAQALLREREIKRSLDMARKAQVALVGIGGSNAMQTVSVSAGLISKVDMDKLVRAKAVGDVIARYVDRQGRELNHSLNRRIVGLDLDSLKKIPTVIGVASGEEKAQAILAALCGKYLKVLVTDSLTAKEVLRISD